MCNVVTVNLHGSFLGSVNPRNPESATKVDVPLLNFLTVLKLLLFFFLAQCLNAVTVTCTVNIAVAFYNWNPDIDAGRNVQTLFQPKAFSRVELIYNENYSSLNF